MAQGQTTRNNLSLRNTEDVQAAFREIKRWGDRLPLASAGFRVQHATTTQNLPANTLTAIDFITVAQNRERWISQVSPYNIFYVPPGLSGLYLLIFDCVISVADLNCRAQIHVNGIRVTVEPMTNQFTTTMGVEWLSEGDFISACVHNFNPATARTMLGVSRLTVVRLSLL